MSEARASLGGRQRTEPECESCEAVLDASASPSPPPPVSPAQARIAGDCASKAGTLCALNGESRLRHYRRIIFR